jgi:hypothetical protein
MEPSFFASLFNQLFHSSNTFPSGYAGTASGFKPQKMRLPKRGDLSKQGSAESSQDFLGCSLLRKGEQSSLLEVEI